MTENALLPMAQQFSGLPMKALIGAPLIAAAAANHKMALSQTEFLLTTCFSKNDLGGDKAPTYQPIMVNMTLTRPVINSDGSKGTDITTEFHLPLLTIMPLNSLGVDNVNVHFEMEVKSAYSNDQNTTTEAGAKTKASYTIPTFFFSEVSGSVSASTKYKQSDTSHYEKSNSAKYEVNIHAGQLPLPEGVTAIIQAFSQTIAPIQIAAKSADGKSH